MLTEINQTMFAVYVNGRLIAGSIPSRMLAEATIMNLPPDQRNLAEIRPMASDGRQVLLG